jgi:hypothetical protein
MRDQPASVVLGLGVFLRLVVYLGNRDFWMDEGSLWGNLAGKPILDFSEPLSGDQLAPLGFLIAQRSLMSLLGTSRYASRLLPLFCGLCALLLFACLARRILPPRPALVALVLFAFSDDLVYYSSELKPYSMDLAVGLTIGLAALDSLGKPAAGRRAVALAILAAAAPWFSFASAFVVAGSGATLILTSLLAGRYRDALLWSAIGIGWLASFLTCYRASLALLSPYTTMYRFWYFAFLPVWPLPMGRARLAETVGIVLEIFVNPLNLVAPVWPWAGVILPIALLLLGGAALARQSWPAWAILVLPIALAMVASGMEQYPLHGRLILELVPAFFLLIALGAERLRGPNGRRSNLGYTMVLVLLLAYPCFAALRGAATMHSRAFNRHGDLHRNLFII